MDVKSLHFQSVAGPRMRTLVLQTMDFQSIVVDLHGKLPAYRDLVPGIVGEDLHQLEAVLTRLGFDPGSADGTYDQGTSTAVARWYESRGWEPFGPTRAQTAAVRSIEQAWEDARKTELAATAALAAAGLG